MTVEARLRPPDRRRPEPLWHQVEREIREHIETGSWPAGTQIPAEDRLCDMLRVSRITIRHALRNLEASGHLRRDHGRGTFVRGPTLVAGTRALTSFTDEMKSLGLKGDSQLLAHRVIPADERVALALQIEPGDPVVMIRRLRLGDNVPIGIQTAHLRLDRAPGLATDGLSEPSLYTFLRQQYGIVFVEATEVYRVGEADPEIAQLLDIRPGSPAFVIERTTIDTVGPVEYTVSTMRGDRYEIRSTLRSTL